MFISTLYKVFLPLHNIWYNLIMILAMATMLIGNLFALRQQNLKRFLAFSSIAQVGFILVGVSNGTANGVTSVVYFILIYLFSNLAALGVVDLISNNSNKENINDYNGLYKTNPMLGWILAIALFSLAGIPPTAGFFGKFFLLSSGAAKGTYPFIAFAAANMIISLYYYLRIIKAMFMSKNDNPISKININPYTKFGLIICSIGIIATGIFSWVYDYIQSLVN